MCMRRPACTRGGPVPAAAEVRAAACGHGGRLGAAAARVRVAGRAARGRWPARAGGRCGLAPRPGPGTRRERPCGAACRPGPVPSRTAQESTARRKCRPARAGVRCPRPAARPPAQARTPGSGCRVGAVRYGWARMAGFLVSEEGRSTCRRPRDARGMAWRAAGRITLYAIAGGACPPRSDVLGGFSRGRGTGPRRMGQGIS